MTTTNEKIIAVSVVAALAMAVGGFAMYKNEQAKREKTEHTIAQLTIYESYLCNHVIEDKTYDAINERIRKYDPHYNLRAEYNVDRMVGRARGEMDYKLGKDGICQPSKFAITKTARIK